MDERNATRRSLLATAGSGLVAAIAGCSAPGSGTGAIRGESSTANSFDGDDHADGTVFTEIYEAVLDSVAMVTVSGIDDPASGEETTGQGSAFVYDESTVVTNEHVIWGGESIELQFPNGDWTDAEVLGSDVYSDLAVLDIAHRPEEAEPLSFADEFPTVGQQVLAIGNPYGFEGSMSQGVVSGVNRSLSGPAQFDIPNVVQTDAGVNPGNSGGPLVDTNARVVGVINAGVSEGIGFAISAALATRVVPNLLETGEYRHSRIGITLQEVDPPVAHENGLTEARGVLVVETDGPADGILQGADEFRSRDGDEIPVGGDVIVAIEDEEIPDQHALSKVLALQTSPGDVVDVTVLRDGQPVTESLELGARPTDVERPY